MTQIRIDALPITVNPSLLHEFPAMKDGLTVKLTVQQIIDLLIDGAPGALDTLNELASALGDDENFASNITNLINVKGVPVGTVSYFAANTPPTGWLARDGSAISRTTYADLFSVIGTTFGVGDGSTTYNLPDGRGEFDRGWDDGRGVDVGRVFGSSQLDENKAHDHTVSFGSLSNTSAGGSALRLNNSGGSVTITSSSEGGLESRPRNIAFLPIIKY